MGKGVKYLMHNASDEYYTPLWAVAVIGKYIPKGSTIWCPFDKKESKYVEYFTDNGYNVVFSHIDNGGDFFNIGVPECDYIISNPPYTKVDLVLERLIEIGKPFAMLINIKSAFDSNKRIQMMMMDFMQFLMIYPRINFTTPDGAYKVLNANQSMYVCRGILPKQIEFSYKENK